MHEPGEIISSSFAFSLRKKSTDTFRFILKTTDQLNTAFKKINQQVLYNCGKNLPGSTI
jgi:hypothetical protein